jgi:hypothetical protein
MDITPQCTGYMISQVNIYETLHTVWLSKYVQAYTATASPRLTLYVCTIRHSWKLYSDDTVYSHPVLISTHFQSNTITVIVYNAIILLTFCMANRLGLSF